MRLPEMGSSKFQIILRGINRLIEEDQLGPGDRLPSERELSERLQAGRSSIREVLRSLELLGLILTKRGEGTFLQPYHSHRFVELLASYILRDNKSKNDLIYMRILLEIGAIRLICSQDQPDLTMLYEAQENMRQAIEQKRDYGNEDSQFHEAIIRLSYNELLMRTWFPVYQYGRYSNDDLNESELIPAKEMAEHEQIIQAIEKQDAILATRILEDHLRSK